MHVRRQVECRVSTEFMEEMIAAIDRLNDLPDVRVAIVTGAGQYFAAGYRGQLRRGSPSVSAPCRQAREMSWTLIENKANVAAINRPAFGRRRGTSIS
jgi:enoyl-CoA hydratase/carnithine racemase